MLPHQADTRFGFKGLSPDRRGGRRGAASTTHHHHQHRPEDRVLAVFYPPNETNRQTVHRIVKLTVKGGTTSITTWGDANLVRDPMVSSLKGTTAYRMVRVVPLAGYPAIWLQTGGRGKLAIALGAILLVAALVTVLRPDKPTDPPGSQDPDGKPGDRAKDPAAGRGNPFKSTAA